MPGTELDYGELPLKRTKLGPPDVYKQDLKQKEDELSTASIKEGFRCIPVVQDEFALARDLSSIGAVNKREHDRPNGPSSRGLSMQTIGMSLSAIVTRKSELCALSDTGRRRLQLSKDNFFLVHQKTRQAADTWLADLSGAEPLSRLVRSIPIFNKREDIFTVLCDHSVSPARAIWYIKLVNLYQTTISTTDVARRPMGGGPPPGAGGGMGSRPMKGPNDPCSEWTQVTTRFLQDLLDRIDTDFAGGVTPRESGSGASSLPSPSGQIGSKPLPSGQQPALMNGMPRYNVPNQQPQNVQNQTSGNNQSEQAGASTGTVRSDLELWQYTVRLCNVMFQERLLDPHELMSWMIEVLHKSNFQHDNTLRLITVFVMHYLEVFASSHFLTRRLAYVCCILIRRLHSAEQNNNQTNHCTRHRLIFAGISNILQYLLVANPQSFVWNDLGDIFNSKRPNSLCPVLFGSPLDDLPCLPSSLPVTSGEQRLGAILPRFFSSNNGSLNQEERVRQCIANAERCVVARSKAYEMFRDPLGILATISPAAVISRRVAELLVRLDRHNFSSNVGLSSLSHLYSFIPPLRWRPNQSVIGTSSISPLVFLPRHLRSKSPQIDAEHCAVVTHLLLWAVLPQPDSPTAGVDEYRWFVATRLLASVRQTSIVQLKNLVSGNSTNNEEESNGSVAPNSNGASSSNGGSASATFIAAEQCVDEVIQEELFDFIGSKLVPLLGAESQLAAKASSLNGECGSSVAALILRNTIHLFAELVENGLFSPTAFMNALVARGYLPCANGLSKAGGQTGPNSGSKSATQLQQISSPPSVHQQPSAPPANVATPLSVTSWPNSVGPASLRTPTKLDSVKEVDSSASMMSPSQSNQQVMNKSATEQTGETNGGGITSIFETSGLKNAQNSDSGTDFSVGESVSTVYSLFLLHFPFPYNRSASMSALNSFVDSSTRRDEENQRGILLYGVGQKRQTVSRAVRRAVRELQRWFSRRHSIDIFTGQLVSSKSSKKASKAPEKPQSSSYAPNQQSQLRIWSSDVSWHDRMAILESVANNDALAALRQIVDAVMNAGPTANKASFADTVPPVPGLSSIFKLADLFIRAQTVRPAIQFASCILRCCPAVLLLSQVHNQASMGGERFAQHYANELLILGVAMCRRFFTCLLAAPDMCISASYALLNAIIAYTVSPAALLFNTGVSNSNGKNATMTTTVAGINSMQIDAFNLSVDPSSSPSHIRFPGSALKLALSLVRELHSNSSDVQGWLAHNHDHYSSFSLVSRHVVGIITADRILPPLLTEPAAMSCLSLSLDKALFIDVIRHQTMSPPVALATLFPLPQNEFDLTPSLVFPLQEMMKNDANRYSIVVNAFCAISEPSATIEYASEMGAMLADICTMACPKLADDLLGALGVLCGAGAVAAAQNQQNPSSLTSTGRLSASSLSRSTSFTTQSTMSAAFIDIRLLVAPNLQSDSRTAENSRINIATAVSVLLARSIFSLSELIRFVLLPVLVHAKHAASNPASSSMLSIGNPLDDREDIEEELESGTSLVYAILKSIISLAELALVGSYPTPAMDAKSAGTFRLVGEAYATSTPVGLSIVDILLLHAHVTTTDCGALLTVLKALLYLGDVAPPTGQGKASIQAPRSLTGNSVIASELFYVLATSPVVRSRLLAEPDLLFRPDMLLDQFLSKEQQRHLVDCLCCTGDDGSVRVSGADPRQRSTLIAILQPLSASSLRRTRLRIQLVYRQVSSTELQQFLDNFGSVVMDMFAVASRNRQNSSSHSSGELDPNFPERLWFIAPLVTSLIECMQSRVLREAWRFLDLAVPPAQSFAKLKEKDRDRLLDTMALVAHPAFLTLVASLVAARRDQADELAKVLFTQLEKFVQCSFTASGILPQSDVTWDDTSLRHEALRLRLALVGTVLDSGILRQPNSATDWALVCSQLLTHQVGTASSSSTACENKSALHALLFDLLTCFIHATMVGTDSFTERDENKKAYIAAVKKLKKEIGECQSPVAREIRRLMPLSRQYYEAFVMEPYGAVFDSRGNQITGLNANARQQGLQIAGVQSLNPWDIVEPGSGWRNSGPISWTWFCARRLDARPSSRFCRLGVLSAYHQPLKNTDASFLEPLPPRQRGGSSSSESGSESDEDTAMQVDEKPVSQQQLDGKKKGKSITANNSSTNVAEMQPMATPIIDSALSTTPLAAVLMDPGHPAQSKIDDELFLQPAMLVQQQQQHFSPQMQQQVHRQRNSSEKHKMPPPPVATSGPGNLERLDSFSDNLPSATLMMEPNIFPPAQVPMQQQQQQQQMQADIVQQQQGPPPQGRSRSRQRRSGEHAQQMAQMETGGYVNTPRPPPQQHGSATKANWNQQMESQIQMTQQQVQVQQQGGPYPNILEQQQQLHQQQQQRLASLGPTGPAMQQAPVPMPSNRGNASSLHDLLASNQPPPPPHVVEQPQQVQQQVPPPQMQHHHPQMAQQQQQQQPQQRHMQQMPMEDVYNQSQGQYQPQQPQQQQRGQPQQQMADSGLSRLLLSPNPPPPPEASHFAQQQGPPQMYGGPPQHPPQQPRPQFMQNQPEPPHHQPPGQMRPPMNPPPQYGGPYQQEPPPGMMPGQQRIVNMQQQVGMGRPPGPGPMGRPPQAYMQQQGVVPPEMMRGRQQPGQPGPTQQQFGGPPMGQMGQGMYGMQPGQPPPHMQQQQMGQFMSHHQQQQQQMMNRQMMNRPGFPPQPPGPYQ